MKVTTFYFLLLCLVTTSFGMNPSAEKAYRELMSNASLRPSKETMDQLVDGLSTCGRYMDQTDQDKLALYREMQKVAISLPNHASYFAEKIEKLRIPGREGYSGCSDPRKRMWIFQDSLSHLPSPETIKILGNFLYDTRDTPTAREVRLATDYDLIPTNDCLAADALGSIGLNKAPLDKKKYSERQDVEIWKLWYEPVKAGTRKFSFAGQDVEYQFNKDGTWITMPLKASNDNRPQVANPGSTVHERPTTPTWPWVAAILALTGAGVWWLKQRKTC